MIFRLLLLLLLIWFLIWLIKKQFFQGQSGPPATKQDNAEDMIACAYCGTHVPKSMAITHHGKNFCCQDHADIDQQHD